MQIILKYDEQSGQITDRSGYVLSTMMGLEHFGEAVTQHKLSVEEICELKKAGFTSDEIIEMSKKEVI